MWQLGVRTPNWQWHENHFNVWQKIAEDPGHSQLSCNIVCFYTGSYTPLRTSSWSTNFQPTPGVGIYYIISIGVKCGCWCKTNFSVKNFFKKSWICCVVDRERQWKQLGLVWPVKLRPRVWHCLWDLMLLDMLDVVTLKLINGTKCNQLKCFSQMNSSF